MSLADPGLALVLDPARLADLVGREVTPTHLRPKPGVSTVAALLDADGLPWGWVRTLTGDALAKAGKVRLRAAELGLAEHLGEVWLGGRDTLVQWGPLVTDPRLASSLAGLDLSAVGVLRYNPLRRFVGRARERGLVVRVTDHAHRDRLTSVTTRLAAHGVPVLTPVGRVDPGLPQGRGVSWWPWVPGVDGSELHTCDAAADGALHDVGHAVGLLHSVDASQVTHLRTRGWADVRDAAVSSVELLEAVSPGTAGSARRVLDQLPEQAPAVAGAPLGARATPGHHRPLVVCHGDLSLDQFLVSTSGEVLLTDFDRAVAAPAVLDHATFAAMDLVEGRESLRAVAEGYAATTGERPVAPGAWVAAVLLARVVEPWRRQVPGWSGETVRRALLAGRALATEDVWAGASCELVGAR
jgi:hypothetical protein